MVPQATTGTSKYTLFLFASREMKKGNIGVVLEILGKKLGGSLTKVDYGLTGKNGVVHPSLEVVIDMSKFLNANVSVKCCFFGV